MKKKLREQLRLLSQQIIETEKTFDTKEIKSAVLDLYNQLIVLEYLENQIGHSSEEMGSDSMDSKSFREKNWFKEPEPVPQPTHKEDLVEPLMEKIKDIVAHMPEESERIDAVLNAVMAPEKKKSKEPEKNPIVTQVDIPSAENEKPTSSEPKNELEEFASSFQQMPEFEPKNPELFPPSTGMKPASKKVAKSKARSLNESINKGLSVGLNDRLAFIKHLFDGQVEGYTRVLSQINTMDSFEEAERFILENVKPDYNNWENKEDYSNRFMQIIENRFI